MMLILILIGFAVLMILVWINRELVKERKAASPYIGLNKQGKPWWDGSGGFYAVSDGSGYNCSHSGWHGGDCGGDGGGGGH